MHPSACALPKHTRGQLLYRGGILALAGSGVLGLARPAEAAVPDADLAYLRLLVAAELLKRDVQGRALGGGKLHPEARRAMRQMRADDKAHYDGLAALLGGSGQAPATPGDIDFSYPKRSFSSERSALALASKLASLALGAYLGALENVQTPALRLPLGQIAANEAQQVGALAQLRGRRPIGSAFAAALPIDVVSAALDEYES